MSRQISINVVFFIGSIALLFWTTNTSPAFAQSDDAGSGIALPSGPQMFFDAQSTGISRDGNRQVFKGDVVAIGAGVILTADLIELDNPKGTLEAKGHVFIITDSQVFAGEKVSYWIGTEDFEIVNANMVSADPARAKSLSQKILGFTPKETEFDKSRSEQINTIKKNKARLRERFRREFGETENVPIEYLDNYALLLEQEDTVRSSENPALAKLSAERRKVYENRRKYWNLGQKNALKIGKARTDYFRIEGKIIKRVNGNDFYGDEAVWSPCLCDEDEAPAWGFRAESLKAQVGGYVDMYHPVLEIKGIPILYLPYLKLPIKGQRQSGFLPPVIAQESKSGTIYSQPVYFVLGGNQDLTLTTELWERRGTKLGIEWRYQQRKYSGWTLKLEGIRDRIWLEERARRQAFLDYHEPDLVSCAAQVETFIQERLNQIAAEIESGVTPTVSERTEAEIIEKRQECEVAEKKAYDDFEAGPKKDYAVPLNTWRTAKIWRGMTILAPRLSFVSNGTVLSDHRYVEELYLPDSFKDVFLAGHQATNFADATSQIHYDGKDYYIGTTSAFGDQVLLPIPYQGHQLPLKLDFASRLFDLDPYEISPVPIYGQVGVQHYRIMDLYRPEPVEETTENQYYLGDGVWQRAHFQLVTPLLSRSIIGIDYFADAEARVIEHDGLSEDRSTIKSWRTGVTFKLPLIGESGMPSWMRDDDGVGEAGIKHRMDWNLTFSVRPVVERHGPYADSTRAEDPFKYYFVGDTNNLGLVRDQSDASHERDAMMAHQRIAFATHHRWFLFERDWTLLPATAKKSKKMEDRETYLEQARRELLFSLDRPVSAVNEIYEGESGLPSTWFINRYRYETKDSGEVVSFSANVEYDFKIAEDREEVIKNNREAIADTPTTAKLKESQLPQPLTPVSAQINLNLAGFSLQGNGIYNTYETKFKESVFGLRFPSFFATTVGVGLKITPDIDSERDREYSASIGTSIIPNVSFALNWGWKVDEVKDGPSERQESYASNIQYKSPSKCWYLNFATSKKYEKEFGKAEYLLEIGIQFMGQQRSVADLAPSVIRDLRPEDES